jgi:hypothetical protein
VPIIQPRSIFASVIVLVLCGRGPAQQLKPNVSAADLVEVVIHNELNTADISEIRWKYRLDKKVDGKAETREVVETKFGSIDRLIAVEGSPLTGIQEREESERILKLSHNPEAQHKLEQVHRKDADQCKAFFQMIPNAFLFEDAGEKGGLTKLTFKPNPHFEPSSREGKVLHEMAGEIWIDAKQHRFVSMNGQLVNEVKFARGLLGHLEKGGHFTVKRSEIARGHWEVTEINVNMQGKVLFFKTISVQQKELHTNFQPVAEDLSLTDAAGLLLKQALVAAKR